MNEPLRKYANLWAGTGKWLCHLFPRPLRLYVRLPSSFLHVNQWIITFSMFCTYFNVLRSDVKQTKFPTHWCLFHSCAQPKSHTHTHSQIQQSTEWQVTEENGIWIYMKYLLLSKIYGTMNVTSKQTITKPTQCIRLANEYFKQFQSFPAKKWMERSEKKLKCWKMYTLNQEKKKEENCALSAWVYLRYS